jgi:hypothetical protein
MTIEQVPGQYPDPIHQRFINYSGKSHTQILCAFVAHRSWCISTLIGVIGAVIINAVLFHPSIVWTPHLQILSVIGAIGLVYITWSVSAPSDSDREIREDYLQIRKTLKEIGFNSVKLDLLMGEYRLRPQDRAQLDTRVAGGVRVLCDESPEWAEKGV